MVGGPDERIGLQGRELSDRLGVLVQAYDGSGEFTLEFVLGSGGDGDGGNDSGGDGDRGGDDGGGGTGDDGDDEGGDDGGFWDVVDDIFQGWS